MFYSLDPRVHTVFNKPFFILIINTSQRTAIKHQFILGIIFAIKLSVIYIGWIAYIAFDGLFDVSKSKLAETGPNNFSW